MMRGVVFTLLLLLITCVYAQDEGRELLNRRLKVSSMFDEDDDEMVIKPRSLANAVDLTNLNSYLSNMKFGASPGPCSHKVHDKCWGDSKNMPAYIAKIRLTMTVIGISFTNNLGNFQTSGGGIDYGWAASGTMDAWETYFYNLQVSRLDIRDLGNNGAKTEVYFSFDMKELSLELWSRFRLWNIYIGIDFLPGWMRNPWHIWNCPICLGLGNTMKLGTNEDNKIFKINQQKLDANNEKIQLFMNMKFGYKSGQNMDTDLPYSMNFVPVSGHDGCKFHMQLSDSTIEFPAGVGYNILGFDIGGILSFFIGLLEGVIAAAVCNAVLQSTWILDGNQNPTTTPGAFNIFLREFYDDVYTYITPGKPSNTDITNSDTTTGNLKTSTPGWGGSMDFQGDEFVWVSETINDILSGFSNSADYAGRNVLVINELVDLLLERKDGVFDVPDPTKPLEHLTIDPSTFTKAAVFEPVVIDVTLTSYKIMGLNTFKDDFIVLSAGQSTLDEPFFRNFKPKQTVHNELTLGNVAVEVSVSMTLSEGVWVTNKRNKRETFTFSASVGLTGAKVDAYTNILTDYHELDPLMLGQFFEGTLEQAADCAMKAVYFVDFPSLQLSMDSLGDVNVYNFGSGLKDTITSIAGIAQKVTKGAFKTKLPEITENLIKPELNTMVRDYMANVQPCWQYVEVKDVVDLIDLNANTVVHYANEGLNRVVGGDPVRKTSFDINTLTDKLITDNINEIGPMLGEGYQLTDEPGSGNFKLWQTDGTGARTAELVRQWSGDNQHYAMLSGVGVSQLGNVYQMDFTAQTNRDEVINFKIGAGGKIAEGSGTDTVLHDTQHVVFDFSLGGRVCRDGTTCSGIQNTLMNDLVAFKLNFDFEVESTLYMELDNNKLMRVTVDNLQNHPMCIVAAFQDYKMSRLSLKTQHLSYTITDEQNGGGFSTSRLGIALSDWQASLGASAGVYTTAQVGYILNRLANEVRPIVGHSAAANKIPFESCETYEYEVNLGPDLQDYFALNTTIVDLPRVRYWPQPDPDFPPGDRFHSYMEWEGKVNFTDPMDGTPIRPFDIRNNSLVENLRNYATSEGLSNPIIQLANSTQFKDNFTVHEDGTVDLHFNLTEQMEPIVNHDYIEGLTITPGLFTMNNITAAKFSLFKIYDEDARFTTKSDISFDYEIDISLEFKIATSGKFVGESGDTVVEEEVRLDFKVDNLVIDIISMLVIDLDLLQNLQIDTFVQVDAQQNFSIRSDWKECILKAFVDDGIDLPGFQIEFSNVRQATLTSIGGDGKLFTSGGADVAGALLDALMELYREDMKDITQGPVREFLVTFLRKELWESKSGYQCPYAVEPDLHGEDVFFNFHQSEQILWFYEQVETEFLNPNSTYNINTYVGIAMATAFTNFATTTSKLPLSYNQADYGTLEVAVSNIEVNGLDTFDKLMLMDYRPIKDANLYPGEYQKYTHRTMFGTGAGDTNVEIKFDLKIVADGLFIEREKMVENDDGVVNRVQDDLRFTFSFSYIDLHTDLVTKMNIKNMLKIKIESFLDIVQYPCLLEAFPENGLQIKDFLFGVGNVTAKVECIDICNSPQLEAIQDFSVGGAESQELNKIMTDGINSTIKLLNIYIKSDDFANTIADEIDYSTTNCIKLGQALDTIQMSHENVAKYMGVVGLSVLFSGLIAFAALIPVHMSRRDDMMKNALLKNANKGGAEASAEFLLAEQKLKSCFTHPAISMGWKYGVPLWVMVNITFFVVANFFSLGAAVQLKIGLLGDTTQPLDLMQFTLESSVDDMWNAGTWVLAVAIALASGGWPYIKNILLLFTWFAPTTILPAKKRGGMMEVLDALGKWSLIDVYVLVMLCVAFRFYISSSYIGGFDSLFPEDLLIIDVVVAPGFGMYGFLLGAMGSLFLNHFMIYQNHIAELADEELEDKINGCYVKETPTVKVAAMKYRFKCADGNGRLYGYGPGAKVSVMALMGLSFLLVLIGSVVDLMTFKFLGIAGIAINLISADLASVTYSLVSIATAIVEGSSDDAVTRLGILFLQIVYLMFAMLVPLILIITFAVLWFVPLRLREQSKLLFAAKILGAWEALLVFVISVIAAIAQISQLAQFIVLNSTGTICANLEKFLLDREVSASDAKCFDVEASLEVTGFIICVGSVMLVVLGIMMIRMIGAVVEDRRAEMKQKECINPKEHTGLKGLLLRATTVPVARINFNHNNNQVAAFSPSKSSYDDDYSRSSHNPMYADIPGPPGSSNIDV